MKKLHNMTFTSFEDMGVAMGIAKKGKRERSKICARCGSEMTNLPGTNIYLCTGKSKTGECGNRLFLKVKTAN